MPYPLQEKILYAKTHVKKSPRPASKRTLDGATVTAALGVKPEYLLLVGRWHGVTKDQERSLKRALKHVPGKLVFVITAERQGWHQAPSAVCKRAQAHR